MGTRSPQVLNCRRNRAAPQVFEGLELVSKNQDTGAAGGAHRARTTALALVEGPSHETL